MTWRFVYMIALYYHSFPTVYLIEVSSQRFCLNSICDSK